MKYIILFIVSIMVFSCNESPEKSYKNKVKNEISPTRELSNEEGYIPYEEDRSVKEERFLAKSIIETMQTDDKIGPTMLTSYNYHIDYELMNKEIQKNEGENVQMLRFNEDLTYLWEKGGEVLQQGKYMFDGKNFKLLLLSRDEKDFPSEWRIKNSGNILVLIGTSTFKNNSRQLHLIGIDQGNINTK